MPTPVLKASSDDPVVQAELETLLVSLADRGGSAEGAFFASDDAGYTDAGATLLAEYAARIGAPSRVTFHLCGHQIDGVASVPCTAEPTFWERVTP